MNAIREIDYMLNDCLETGETGKEAFNLREEGVQESRFEVCDIF